LSIGSHTITANYQGDINFALSFSSLTQTVQQDSTTTIITSSSNPSVYGRALSFTADVQPTSPEPDEPSGTVQFVIDGVNFGPPDALVDGLATSNSIATLGAGGHTISATYSGDNNFMPSVSGELVQSIARAPLTITVNDETRSYGQPNPVLTASYIGFVNGDSPAGLTNPVVLSTSAVVSSEPGSYPITAFGASSPNYVITFLGGTLTVLPLSSRVDRGRLAFVTSLYGHILGRAPETAGLQYWMKELGHGLKPRVVPPLFWDSTEHRDLVLEHRAPKISLRKARNDALKAWTQAARSKPLLPKGPLGLVRHAGRAQLRV